MVVLPDNALGQLSMPNPNFGFPASSGVVYVPKTQVEVLRLGVLV
jgi:hypothetical protein